MRLRLVSALVLVLLSASPVLASGRAPVVALRKAAPALDASVLELALRATSCAERRGLLADPSTLTVIDYSRPSTATRLFVLDLASGALIRQELVAHGRNSGDNLATHFSNVPGSYQSSLGLFVTLDRYVGRHGRSLRLEGLEHGINDRAFERAIVMHGASYVGAEFAAVAGRIGRSFGCPAVRREAVDALIDRIHGGSAVFAYYPDPAWLARSSFLGECAEAPSGVGQLADERDEVADALIVDDALPRRHQR
jgi:hypothetical protein